MTPISPRLARIQERAQRAVSHVSLFPLVRETRAALSELPGSGEIRFSHPPSFTMPAGEVREMGFAAGDSGGVVATLTTTLLGLLGAESPLPSAMSEEVLLQDETGLLTAFHDAFQSRALSLLYEAWHRYDPSSAVTRGQEDDFSRGLLSFMGMDAFSSYPASVGGDRLFMLGLSDFARCDPSSLDLSALEALLSRVFPDLAPRVRTCAPVLVEEADEDGSRLGEHEIVLGEAYYGTTALDATSALRLVVGPVDRPTYEALLPGGDKYAELYRFAETWLGSRARVELEVRMAAEDGPQLLLGEEYGGYLGLDAQYHSEDATQLAARFPLVAQPDDTATTYECLTEADEDSTPHEPFAEPARVDDLWKRVLQMFESMSPPDWLAQALAEGGERARAGRPDTGIDQLVYAIDTRLGAVADGVLHHPAFQRLEARWRGLAYLADHVSFEENIRISVFDASKDVLAHDLESASELVKTHLFASVYSAELGTLGGSPYAAILADMEFDTTTRDVGLLQKLCAIGAVAHAPFFAAASPRLLRVGDEWKDLPAVRSAVTIFENPECIRWHALRDHPDSRAAGLLVGRPLHRKPYEATTHGGAFPYHETLGAEGAELLFGSPIYVFATRLAASFARHRTLSAILGDDEDACPAPAVLSFASLGERYTCAPLEITITPRLERSLRAVGLIPLMHRTGDARIFLASANSLQRPKRFGTSEGGAEATLNHLLGTKFPYFFLACRFAHFLKALEREMVGTQKSPADVEQHLNGWLSHYVLHMNGASAAMRARHPLRGGRVAVTSVEGMPGWNRSHIQLRPHLRYRGQGFSLNTTNWIGPNKGQLPPLQQAVATLEHG